MKEKSLNVITAIVRTLFGAVCIFSGFVKAIDPLGTAYKIEDYLNAFGGIFPNFTWIALPASIALSMFEFALGCALLFNLKRKLTSWLAFVFMLFMTVLTLYIALENPVSDCGCFGDAIVLDNWTTFYKNIVLMAMVIWLLATQRYAKTWFVNWVEWSGIAFFCLVSIVLSVVCLRHLPFIDFRPYKVGTDIEKGMEIPEGAPADEYHITFIYEKDGVQQEFTLEDCPDSTWTFVETRNILKEKGYEPPIHDFYMIDMETGEDITKQVLTNKGYTFLLIAHRIEEADDGNIDLINEIYDYSVEHGYVFYALTASQEDDILLWCDRTGAEYPFYIGEDVVLKTIVRSNPGLLLLKEGTILNKWSDNNLPDEYVLTDALDKIPLGQQKPVSVWLTMGKVVLWFIVPFFLILVFDLLVVKRKENKKLGEGQQ